MPSKVTFNERVTVASLPIQEYRDAYYARRGPWGPAPLSDELWDGDRRVFWEKELTSEELKEILRFRRLVKYAALLHTGIGIFGLKVPMPKVPPVIEELVKLSNVNGSPKSGSQIDHLADSIANPSEEKEDSSPRPTGRRRSANVSVTSIEAMYSSHTEERFEIENPTQNPASPLLAEKRKSNETKSTTISLSQKAAMRDVGKVLRLDSPHIGRPVHKTRSKKTRAQKRIAAHSMLQPWFVLLYFSIPLMILGNIYLVPFFQKVFLAWRSEVTIRAALEIPLFVERLLPNIPVLQQTLTIGVFVVEMASVIYLLLLLISQLVIFFLVRPLLQSLASSFSERGAAPDSLGQF